MIEITPQLLNQQDKAEVALYENFLEWDWDERPGIWFHEILHNFCSSRFHASKTDQEKLLAIIHAMEDKGVITSMPKTNRYAFRLVY